MAEQDKLDRVYMNMAKELATLSTATRAKVGSLIVRDTHILSEGVNGTPRGFNNSCEIEDFAGHIRTKEITCHAESNAITKIARSTNHSCDATLYVTLAPCVSCSKLIIQSGIVRVVYGREYPNSGLHYLEKAGIEVLLLE